MDEQKKLRIVNEILNDAFWLSYILDIKRKLTDYNQKELLSCFLLNFAPVFCEEIIVARYSKPHNDSTIMRKKISDLRHSNLKDCFTSSSRTANSILSEMGIDFDNYVFDLVLTTEDSKIIDINFRYWNYVKEENLELFNGILSTPTVWVEELLPKDIYSSITGLLEDVSNQYIRKISNLNIEKKSYSSYKLFNQSHLKADDKLYILQRYGLIQLIAFVDTIFKEKITITIPISNGDIKLDINTFKTKCKAILLEMFWNDKNQNKSITVLNEVFQKNDIDIPNDFFELNRKIRNNLHYGDYHFVTEDEINYVMKYQDVYLENIKNVFDKFIHINFGAFYRAALWIAKLNRFASSK